MVKAVVKCTGRELAARWRDEWSRLADFVAQDLAAVVETGLEEREVADA